MKTTLETSGEDAKTTLETSGEDVKTTLKTSGEDRKLHSKWVGKTTPVCYLFLGTTLVPSVISASEFKNLQILLEQKTDALEEVSRKLALYELDSLLGTRDLLHSFWL